MASPPIETTFRQTLLQEEFRGTKIQGSAPEIREKLLSAVRTTLSFTVSSCNFHITKAPYPPLLSTERAIPIYRKMQERRGGGKRRGRTDYNSVRRGRRRRPHSRTRSPPVGHQVGTNQRVRDGSRARLLPSLLRRHN